MSRKSPSRRPPCGASSIQEANVFIGECGQYNGNNSGSVIVYQNATKVPTYLTTGEANIDPYYRWVSPAQTNCAPNFELPCGDGVNGERYCNIPTGSGEFNSVPQGLQITSGRYTNSFVDLGITQLGDPCSSEIGEKRVFARKTWHGIIPFDSPDHQATLKMDWCERCLEAPGNYVPETTHYLTITGNSNYSKVETGNPTVTGYANASSTVNKWTGKVTATTQSGSGDGSSGPADIAASLLQGYIVSTSPGAGAAAGILELYHSIRTDWAWVNEPEVKTGNGYSWNLSWTFGGSTTTATLYINWTGQLSFIIDYADGGFTEYTEISLYYTPTTVTYYKQIYQDGGGYTYDEEWSVTANLSHTYTSAQVAADCKYLLSLIDLGDDKLPWQSGLHNNGPLISYDEDSEYPTLWLDNYTSTSPATGNIKGLLTPVHVDKYWNPDHENWELCTSELCISKYVESYGAWSTDCGYPCATQWLNKKEMSMIPYGCSFNQAGQMWTTPSSCNPVETKVNDNVHWMCKQALLLNSTKPSFNYAKPHGVDRLQIVEGSNRCVSSSLGTTLYLDSSEAGDEYTSSLDTGDYALVLGVSASVDGLWSNVTKTGDYTLVLGTMMASASQFPTLPFTEYGDGMIGKCKQTSAAGIEGRVTITAMTSTNPIVATLAEPTHLINGDIVRVTNAQKMNIEGYYSITLSGSSNQHIFLNGTDGTGKTYIANSGQLYSKNAFDWKWNDTLPKGEYVVHKWLMNFRDVGEYYRLVSQYSASIVTDDCASYIGDTPVSCSATDYPNTNPRGMLPSYGQLQTVADSTHDTACMPPSECGTTVAYFAPSNEVLLESRYDTNYHGWYDVLIDSVYGSQWIAAIQEYDISYDFQAPPCVCTERNMAEDPEVDDPIMVNTCNCTWTEDNGICAADQDRVEESGIELLPCLKYYPYRPIVEARADIPDGAPAVFQKSIRYLNVQRLLVGDTNGRVMVPPSNGAHFYYDAFTFQYSSLQYFSIYQNLQGCCPDGRFMDTYMSYGVRCNETEI